MAILIDGDHISPRTYEPLRPEDWREYDLSNPEIKDCIISNLSELERKMIPPEFEMSTWKISGKYVYVYDCFGGYNFDDGNEDILYVIKNSELDMVLRLELLRLSKKTRPHLP